MPFQTGEKIGADSGQEAPFQLGMTNTTRNIYAHEVGRNCSFSDNHNNLEISLPLGDRRGLEYLNALSSGREDKGRLWPGSPFFN